MGSLSARALGVAALLSAVACAANDEPITSEVSDDFNRAELGRAWRDPGDAFHLTGDELAVTRAAGRPLWLRRRLPADVMIEVDARTPTDDGEIALELFGDGKAADPGGGSCASTGYALVWRGSHAAICRENEAQGGHHSARGDWNVVGGRVHHYAIIRRGGLIDWKVDGLPMLQFKDPQPLMGRGHDHFGFTGRDGQAVFDDLVIRPAPATGP